MCDVDRWLSGRVSARQSVVAGSIISARNQGIHNWWVLVKSRQLSSGSVRRVQGFAGFSGYGNSIYNTIPLLQKENMELLVLDSINWDHLTE